MEAINWFMTVVTQHYADFSGRARRAEFWWYALVNFIVYAIADTVPSVLGLGHILGYLLLLLLLPPLLGVSARRLHDTGRSGWWTLLGLTVLGAIPLVYWWTQPGMRAANNYGPDPMAARL